MIFSFLHVFLFARKILQIKLPFFILCFSWKAQAQTSAYFRRVEFSPNVLFAHPEKRSEKLRELLSYLLHFFMSVAPVTLCALCIDGKNTERFTCVNRSLNFRPSTLFIFRTLVQTVFRENRARHQKADLKQSRQT